MNRDQFYSSLAVIQYFKLWKSAINCIMDQSVMFHERIYKELIPLVPISFYSLNHRKHNILYTSKLSKGLRLGSFLSLIA